MRILNVSQTYYPYLAEGGRPAKVLAISRALAERGQSVTVLTADLHSGRSGDRPAMSKPVTVGQASHASADRDGHRPPAVTDERKSPAADAAQ